MSGGWSPAGKGRGGAAKRFARIPSGGIVLAFTLSLAGCAPALVIGAGAAAGTAAMQERGLVKAAEDVATEVAINANLLGAESRLFFAVNAEVYEGRALLTGSVDNIGDRIEAVRIAWNTRGVREVINEIRLRDDRDIVDAARDRWITAQLTGRITFDNRIKAINYSVETVNGIVYLIGVAQNQVELARVVDHARQLANVRRVISYVRVITTEDDRTA